MKMRGRVSKKPSRIKVKRYIKRAHCGHQLRQGSLSPSPLSLAHSNNDAHDAEQVTRGVNGERYVRKVSKSHLLNVPVSDV